MAATTFVVTDVETTGTFRDCRIIEIGAVRVVGGAPAGTFQSLIDPDRLLSGTADIWALYEQQRAAGGNDVDRFGGGAGVGEIVSSDQQIGANT